MEPVDNWNPFDMRRRKSALQALYVGLTWAAFTWALLIGAVMILLSIKGA